MSIDRAAWDQFLGGHWQKGMPLVEGTFPRTDAFGAPLEFVCVQHFVTGWRPEGYRYGWWWSEPIPQLPKPPPWDVES